MQVTKEPLDPCQVALTIEVEGDKVVVAVDRAYREYAKYVSVPGFRKGKAPLSFVRQRIPESDVRQRTAEILVEPAYNEALKQEEIQPFAAPKLELMQLQLSETPFIFKAVVPLAPEVEIGPYTGLTVERNQYELSEDNIATQVERLRERAADYPQVERPVAAGDLVVAEISAVTELRPEAAEPRRTMIEIGADNIPGFDDQVLGLSAGDTRTFTLTYPDNYPDADLVGEEVEFTLTVEEVREKEIPPLDDALALKISGGKMETLDALKQELRADLEKSLTESSDRDLEGKLIDQVLSHSTIKFPPVLVEAEVEDDVKELLERIEKQGVSLDDYLKQVGKTREQLMVEFQEAADKRIRIGLLLGKVAETEQLALTDADLEAALAARAAEQQTTPAAMRAFLESNGTMEALRNRTQTKKVLDFLRGSAIIENKIVTADTSTVDQAAEEQLEEEIEEAEALEGGDL